MLGALRSALPNMQYPTLPPLFLCACTVEPLRRASEVPIIVSDGVILVVDEHGFTVPYF